VSEKMNLPNIKEIFGKLSVIKNNMALLVPIIIVVFAALLFVPTYLIGSRLNNHIADESISKGARCLIGGKVPDMKGAYYPATVLAGVKKGMPAYDEELFGPVAALITVPDEAEAIRVANDSIFGLGAAVFTKNIERGKEIAEKEIEAGACFVNDFVKSDPRLPFGGIKESGYGRELSHYGIKEFVNIKTIYIK